MNEISINAGSFELRTPSGALVPAMVSYNTASRTATLLPFTPTGTLAYSTTHTAIVKGGAGDPHVSDLAGNPLAIHATWLFTTEAAPPPPSDTPILAVTPAASWR